MDISDRYVNDLSYHSL